MSGWGTLNEFLVKKDPGLLQLGRAVKKRGSRPQRGQPGAWSRSCDNRIAIPSQPAPTCHPPGSTAPDGVRAGKEQQNWIWMGFIFSHGASERDQPGLFKGHLSQSRLWYAGTGFASSRVDSGGNGRAHHGSLHRIFACSPASRRSSFLI